MSQILETGNWLVGNYWYKALLPSGLKIGSPPTGSIGVQQEGAAPLRLALSEGKRSDLWCLSVDDCTDRVTASCSPHAVPGRLLASTAKSKSEALR